MSRSSSSNKTELSQSTTDITTSSGDNRVTDSGNIGGNVTVGEAGGSVNVTTTDYGAIESGERVSMAALDFVGDSMDTAAGISRAAIASATDINEQSLDFAESALGYSHATTRDALEANDYAQERAYGFSESIAQEAFLSNSLVSEQALEFGSSTMSDALSFGETALAEVTDSFKFWNQMTSQNTDRALAFAAAADRSEGAELMATGIKFLSVAAVTVGVAVVAVAAFRSK